MLGFEVEGVVEGDVEFGFVALRRFLRFRMLGVVPFVSFVLPVGLVEFSDPLLRPVVPFGFVRSAVPFGLVLPLRGRLFPVPGAGLV